jgi:hypothetical protein
MSTLSVVVPGLRTEKTMVVWLLSALAGLRPMNLELLMWMVVIPKLWTDDMGGAAVGGGASEAVADRSDGEFVLGDTGH